MKRLRATLHTLPPFPAGWEEGGGGVYTVLQISSDGHDRMGPLFHVTFTWQLRPLLAWQKFIKDLLR